MEVMFLCGLQCLFSKHSDNNNDYCHIYVTRKGSGFADSSLNRLYPLMQSALHVLTLN